MTSFCSQCGKQIRAGGKFCQSCGAPSVQSAAAGSQSNPTPSQPSQPPASGYAGGYPGPSSGGYQSSFPAQQAGGPMGQSPYGAPAAPRSGKALKVILITLAVLLVLIGGAVVTATYFIKRTVGSMVQVNDGKDGQPNVVLDIPGVPKISAGAGVSEAELGVPIYPGAEALKDGTSSVSISGGTSGSSGWLGVATFTTDDSLDQVVAFYKEKLGQETRLVESSSDGKRSAVFQIESAKGWRMVTVGEDDTEDVTKIVIASVSGKGAQ